MTIWDWLWLAAVTVCFLGAVFLGSMLAAVLLLMLVLFISVDDIEEEY